MRDVFQRRWTTLALLLWLPLVKWSLPAGSPRLLLFYGGGCALAILAVWREGDWARVRPLFAHPWRGVAWGLLGYGALVGVALLLLAGPGLGRWLPSPVLALVSLFDPRPAYLRLTQGGPLPSASTLTVFVLGSIAEEWLFRTVLFWRWLPERDRNSALRAFSHPGPQARLAAVSVYFALLHWPQPPGAILVALVGSLVVGIVLLGSRSFSLAATLHVLFNLRLLL